MCVALHRKWPPYSFSKRSSSDKPKSLLVVLQETAKESFYPISHRLIFIQSILTSLLDELPALVIGSYIHKNFRTGFKALVDSSGVVEFQAVEKPFWQAL